ncbi:peroxiredoxin-like family protein [Streptomyces sp. NBC_01643]|uniref:peroxiredoxin-like family protein n=1 Tax=Streptomyces sp. NBC_01643 TaxID=2975906 RepID=UPI002F9140A0|nr:AhpC/TSA family protein [Streptomyces sp. NBC_01643]
MPAHRKTHQIAVGSVIESQQLTTISGATVGISDPDRITHLQFRRFAGCPVCNMHLQSIVRRHDEIIRAGVRELVVFHSTVDELNEHAAHLPFAVIADPHKRLYVDFGVESSPRSLLHPRAWGSILRAIVLSLVTVVRGGRPPTLIPKGGRFGLPADFLIGRDGRVLDSKYGDHVYDQWSVDELLQLVKSHARYGSYEHGQIP